MWSSIVCTLGRRGTQWEDSPERNRALSYTVLPLVSYASLLVAAILLPSQPVPALVCHRCGNDAAPVHWHPQRMGCRDLHGLRTPPMDSPPTSAADRLREAASF